MSCFFGAAFGGMGCGGLLSCSQTLQSPHWSHRALPVGFGGFEMLGCSSFLRHLCLDGSVSNTLAFYFVLFEELFSLVSVETSSTKEHTMTVLAGVVQQTVKVLDQCVLLLLTFPYEKSKIDPGGCLGFGYPEWIQTFVPSKDIDDEFGVLPFNSIDVSK